MAFWAAQRLERAQDRKPNGPKLKWLQTPASLSPQNSPPQRQKHLGQVQGSQVAVSIFKEHQALHPTLPPSPIESIVILPTPPSALRTASTDTETQPFWWSSPSPQSSALCHSRLSTCSVEVHFGFVARKEVIIKLSGENVISRLVLLATVVLSL